MNLFDYPLAAFVGVALALGVCGSAALAGFSRERGFYPLMVIVIAGYYILFALQAASMPALWSEIAALLVFALLAIAGYKKSAWIVVAALALHGIFDAVHASVIANPGVPLWWPPFCLTFDVTMAAVLALRLAAEKQKGPQSLLRSSA